MIPALVLAAVAASAPPAAYVYAHHAISTTDPVSQAMFDRGLTLFYSYNGSEGVHVFQALEQREPKLAIAYWGEALGDGPDINTPLDEAHFNLARAAIEKAAALEAGASDSERAYIDALRVRFSGTWKNQATAERDYRRSMAAAVAKFPLDGDLGALYVEALLEDQAFNNNFDLWKPGTTIPANAETAAIVPVLDEIVARDPQHLMANHLIIHIYEPASDHSKPLLSAARLDAMTFAPENEHLTHMTAHTYIDVGEYAKVVVASQRAIAMFDAYLATPGIDRTHARYLHHDVAVGYSGAMMLGNFAQAAWFADRLSKLPKPVDVAALTSARFGRWADVQTAQAKNAADPVHFALAMWKLHQGDAADAQAELGDALDVKKRDDSYLLYALRGAADMQQHNSDGVSSNFKKALAMENDVYTGETIPQFPTSEILGGAYYRARDYADAEVAYRHALDRYPNDARALYGLSQTLAKEGKTTESQTIAAQFANVWQGSDTTLTPADL